MQLRETNTQINYFNKNINFGTLTKLRYPSFTTKPDKTHSMVTLSWPLLHLFKHHIEKSDKILFILQAFVAYFV